MNSISKNKRSLILLGMSLSGCIDAKSVSQSSSSSQVDASIIVAYDRGLEPDMEDALSPLGDLEPPEADMRAPALPDQQPPPMCGDGVLDQQEECDDANLDDTDECLSDCTHARCGDGKVQLGVELCDDGNTLNNDQCTTACQPARCGDGLVQLRVEECDDGNSNHEDTCTSDCTIAACGDGYVQAGVEECDDGNRVTETCQEGESSCTVCDARCKRITLHTAVCGDSLTSGDELCDGQERCPDDCGLPCASSAQGCPVLQWVEIDGGDFEMGSLEQADTQPIRTIQISPFKIMKTEVTIRAYQACVAAGYCTAPTASYQGCTWGMSDELPVSCITWHAARAFARWVGGRLPSEAEWEFVATNGGVTRYPWGDAEPTCDYTQHACAIGELFSPPCSKVAGNTSHGVCDLLDGVIEWTQDKYDPYDPRAQDGYPVGNHDQNIYRAIRGGNHSRSLAPSFTRYGACQGNNACNMVGLRVVKDLDQDQDGVKATLDCDDHDATNERIDDCDYDQILRSLDCDDRSDLKGSYLNDQACVGDQPPCATSSAGCPALDFVMIPAGDLLMGSEAVAQESPVHSVSVPRFMMMRTEVTVAMYQKCVEARVCSPYSLSSTIANHNYRDRLLDHPVNLVRWQDMMIFAAWVGARLPTESEWEYAARRVGEDSVYPWGSALPTCAQANYQNCGSGTSAVCSHPDGNTRDGLCDMAGNVWEWTQDEWHSDYTGAPLDGSGWCATGLCPSSSSSPNYASTATVKRVLRSGSFMHNIYNMRTTNRVGEAFTPSFHYTHTGGRLARSIVDQSQTP